MDFHSHIWGLFGVDDSVPIRSMAEQKLYDEIGSNYHNAATTQVVTEAQTENSALEETEVPTETTTEVKHYSVMEGAANLLSINPEVIGYISIPDTEVDYPVMQHPNDVEGDEYYLHHDLQGNRSQNGSIFLDSRCSFDAVGADGTLAVPNSDNLIVYGHDMRIVPCLAACGIIAVWKAIMKPIR